MRNHQSPEERPTLVGVHDGHERGEIGSRTGGVIAVPLEVSAHPVELPLASRVEEAEAGDSHACPVAHTVPRRPHFPDGHGLAIDLALEAQLVCILGTGATTAQPTNVRSMRFSSSSVNDIATPG